jgi:hypothetical protein
MENDIALMAVGYLLTRIGVLVAFGYLFYRILRPTPTKVRFKPNREFSGAGAELTRLRR